MDTKFIKEEKVIRDVLLLKYEEKQASYLETIFDFLEISKKWISKALLFDLSTYQRKGIKTWDWKERYRYEYDSILVCNFRLEESIIAKLLKIQRIDFWNLYLNKELYKNAINDLQHFPKFDEFIKDEWRIDFPTREWGRYLESTTNIFNKIEQEKIVERLKSEKLRLFLISKNNIYNNRFDYSNDSNSRVQINMINVLLYSVLFNLDFITLTRICIFLSHLMIIIEEGEDTADKQSDNRIIQSWYENGNWNLIINHYAAIFIAESNNSKDNHFKEYLEIILQETDIELLPFKIIKKEIGHADKINNERIRTNINSVRIGESSEPIFTGEHNKKTELNK